MRKLLLVLLAGLFLYSCTAKCENQRAEFVKQKPCNIFITKSESIGQICELYGYDVATGQKTAYKARAGLFYAVNDCINVGDTLLKLSGSDWFLVKRKGYRIKLSQKCTESGKAIGLRKDTIYSR